MYSSMKDISKLNNDSENQENNQIAITIEEIRKPLAGMKNGTVTDLECIRVQLISFYFNQ